MAHRLVPVGYDDWRTDPDYGRSDNEIREREAEHDNDMRHADCLTETLSSIAVVAAQNLKAYKLNLTDETVVDWLEGVRDDLMDNLLWQEWGNASDHVPSDRRAHCEQVWKAAKEQ